MIKDGNETLEDRLIFVDYDQATFSYRAFDLLYFIKNWPVVSFFLVSHVISCAGVKQNRKLLFQIKSIAVAQRSREHMLNLIFEVEIQF